MVTKCVVGGRVFRCSIDLGKGFLTVKELNEVRPLEVKLPLTQIINALLLGNKVKLVSSNGLTVEIFINEIVRKEVNFTLLIIKYLREGDTLKEKLNTTVVRYAILNNLVFELITSLTKKAVPNWIKVRELSLTINNEILSLQDLDIEDLKFTSSKLLKDVEIRDVTQIPIDVKNLMRYLVSTFKEAIKKMNLSVDITPLIDLILLTYVYRYSKKLGFIIQAGKALNAFTEILESFTENFIGFNESLKTDLINNFLTKFKTDEDLLQTSKAYLELIELIIKEFL